MPCKPFTTKPLQVGRQERKWIACFVMSKHLFRGHSMIAGIGRVAKPEVASESRFARPHQSKTPHL